MSKSTEKPTVFRLVLDAVEDHTPCAEPGCSKNARLTANGRPVCRDHAKSKYGVKMTA